MRRVLLVIVPYRGRPAQLTQFMQRVWAPLHREWPNSRLVVAEQSDDGRRFNRGLLLNCAYDLCRRRDVWRVLLHDVDLVPDAHVRRQYYAARGAVLHFAHCWAARYSGSSYFGGVVGMSPRAFERIDGFPNAFWGWGGEDDALLRRVRAARLLIRRPCAGGSYVDLEALSLHEKLRALRARGAKCPNKRALLARQRALPGLRQARYRARWRSPTHVVLSIAECP